HRPAEEIAFGSGGLAERAHELAGRDPEEIDSSGARHAAVAVDGRADQDHIPAHRERRPEEIARRGGGLLDDEEDLSRPAVEEIDGPGIGRTAVVERRADEHVVRAGPGHRIPELVARVRGRVRERLEWPASPAVDE